MAAGSIVIDLLMRTGSFETDTKRAEAALKKFQKQASDVGKTIGVGIAAGVTLAVAAFDQLIKSAGDFKDLEETIGSSAEDIASLSIAAATAGVSMESVTSATIKLTKGLVGVDDESKAAGAALKALGINVEEFKRLDPVAQYEAVGKALAGFADGAQKTAVAVALFGKSGAEQLRVFKALEEQGGRQVILTQKQIELADAYADAQAKQIATFKQYAQAAATDVLPSINLLIEAAAELAREFGGIDAAGKKLSGESPVKQFADNAVDALAFVVDAAQGVARIFDVVGKSIGARSAQVAAALRGEFGAVVQIGKDAQEQIDSILNAELFSQKIARIRAAASFKNLGADPTELARRGRGPATLPQLQFDGTEKAAKATRDKTTEADRYLESLDKQLQKTRELTEVERVLDDIQNGRFQGAKAGQANLALAKADELDRAKQLEIEGKKAVDLAREQEEASNRLREAGKRVFEDTRTPAEQYAIQLEALNKLLAAGAVQYDTYARAVKNLQEQFDENAKRIKEIAQDINATIESNGADLFANFITGSMSAKDAFKNFANSVINDLIRIGAQDLAKSLFGGGKDQAGGLGGLLAGLFGGGGSGGFGTGSSFGNQDYGAFLATGTNSVPYDGFKAVLHKGEAVVPAKYNPANGGGGTDVQVINPPGVPLQARAVQERQPDGKSLIKLFMSEVAQNFRDGGEVAQAASGTFGLRRQLPRRGN